MKAKLSIGIIAPFVLLLLVACGGSQSSVTQGVEPTDSGSGGVLSIHFLDVGQGDSIVIVTPHERVVLIDAGTRQSASAIVDDLAELGIFRINLAITTHPHADHIGGYIDVFDDTEVLRYGDPGFPGTSAMYANLLERVEQEGSRSYQLHVGQRIVLDDGIEMRVLSPPVSQFHGTRSDANANSVVLLLQYGDFDAVFMGDAEAETEETILHDHLLGDVDVIKVAHHGSAYASTQAFLDVIRPEYAIISCGAGNTYGHPSPDTVQRLEEYAVDGIFRTDLVGTITLETNGDWIRVETEHAPAQVLLFFQVAALVH